MSVEVAVVHLITGCHSLWKGTSTSSHACVGESSGGPRWEIAVMIKNVKKHI